LFIGKPFADSSLTIGYAKTNDQARQACFEKRSPQQIRQFDGDAGHPGCISHTGCGVRIRDNVAKFRQNNKTRVIRGITGLKYGAACSFRHA
jgi:hypothetical protein